MNSDLFRAPRRQRLISSFALVCALACVQARAHAQAPAPAREEAEGGEYKELIEQALSEFRHKNWPEARVLFRRAHALAPSARTLRGMGIVSYEMRDYVQAVRDLSAALADTRQPLTEQQKGECQTLLSRSRTFVGVFEVRVTPPEAQLRLDGAPLARESDGSVVLAFGEHEVSAEAAGYEPGSARVRVQGGERGELELRLVPEASGGPVAAAATDEQPLEPERPVATEPGREPEGFRGGGLRYTWAALAVSALFGGGAAAAYFVGDKELEDLDADCERKARLGQPCRRGSVDTDHITRYQRLTNAALGVSAVALVTTLVVGYFEWPREARAPGGAAPRERSVSIGLGPTSLMLRREF
jgi:hypothetical protein